jgi:hypothetical protein
VSTGFRAIICEKCIDALRVKLDALEQPEHSTVAGEVNYSVPGAECVFCERILTTARFSMRRWIFGICDTCACSMADRQIGYSGMDAQSYEF